jgi:hypothetical protein
MPVHSAHAVAASTFSTLWAPRSWISPTGHTGSACPLSLATTQPSWTKMPCASARVRLNQSTRARVRGASAAVSGSSAFSTAQSDSVWLAKMRALAST